jgi:putative ATP-dependent endonuclease of the OLD family
MPRIRKVEIRHFRSIQEFSWCPSSGINCIIGPGDSGKSSILDAIDLCLSARRNIQCTDADFYKLDVEEPVVISITIGELDDALKNLETYGVYIRGFDSQSGEIEDEPDRNLESVITVRITITSDLEPSWSLVSDRAHAMGLERNLNWNDRVRLSPTRIGMMADYHLGWRHGSVLNRISDERVDASAALAKAARDARSAFGDQAQDQLGQTLAIVERTAKELGIITGDNIKALLDVHSVSFSGGAITMHDAFGIPLRGLGTGSIRLLIAGLQRVASVQSTIILLDELEYGLEPHRIIRLLGSLGAKEAIPPLQVFMTTHSPVALRELSGSQLFVTRKNATNHALLPVGIADNIQSTIRLFPDAFLASSVIICEGASEIGLIRGLDQYRVSIGLASLMASGTSLIDCGGGEADKPFKRAAAFLSFGYRVAILRDNDQTPTLDLVTNFLGNGGKVVSWREGRALEDELFLSFSNSVVNQVLNHTIELYSEGLINEHIKSASQNHKNLNAIRDELHNGGITTESRNILGEAAKMGTNKWFKSVTKMEDIAREIIGPNIVDSDREFRLRIEDIFTWANNAVE